MHPRCFHHAFPLVLLASLCCPFTNAQSLDALTHFQNYSAHRISSSDPTGGNLDMRRIDPGQTLTLADLQGPGEIRHIWFTFLYPSRSALRKLVLRAEFDDIKLPCIDSPLGDFFGLGHALTYDYASTPLAVGTHAGLNCYWQMPFAKRARLTLTNQGSQPCVALYYQIDYRTFETAPPDNLHFFAAYRQAFPPKTGEPYEILQTDGGRGHYVGCNLSIEQNADSWWGEGDTRIYIDGQTKPIVEGTGSEDDFGGAWCYSHEFSYPQFGAPLRARFNSKGTLDRCTTLRDTELSQWKWPAAWQKGDLWNVYRYRLSDPIPFTQSIKVNIEHGSDPNNQRPDWLSSVAYWYQSGSPTTRPALPPVTDRVPDYLRPHDHGNGKWEAEDFADTAKISAGKIEEAGMDFWGDLFSARYGLNWEPTADNQTLDLPFTIEKQATYRTTLRAFAIEQGGAAKFSIDDSPTTTPVDL